MEKPSEDEDVEKIYANKLGEPAPATYASCVSAQYPKLQYVIGVRVRIDHQDGNGSIFFGTDVPVFRLPSEREYIEFANSKVASEAVVLVPSEFVGTVSILPMLWDTVREGESTEDAKLRMKMRRMKANFEDTGKLTPELANLFREFA